MARPFVILVPEPERERLRTAGIIPPGMFRPFNANSIGLEDGEEDERTPLLHLWPYDVCYDVTHYRKARDERRPLDVPGFFGMAPALEEAQKRHNERLITRLLGSVLVHIVFLDKRVDRNGYAVFRSFNEIADWGWCLKDALDLRFRNEEELQARENVLVVVARGEQVTVTRKELRKFEECVGRDRIFTSCYFLDYNLRVGDTRSLFHSADVWDVVVGRLLLAFLLSQPRDNHGHGCWQRPGIKLWRAMDCAAEIAPRVNRRLMDEALNSASLRLHEMLASEGMDDPGKSPLLAAGTPAGPDLEDALGPLVPAVVEGDRWKQEPSGGWSDFDATECVRKTRDDDGDRWKPARETIRRIFPPWRFQQKADDGEKESRSIMGSVHAAPSRLFDSVKRLFARLAEKAEDAGTPADSWNAMVAAEQSWRASVAQMASDAGEFEKAQKHYVGWGLGLLVFMSASLMFGWVIHRLVGTIGPVFGVDSGRIWLASVVLFGFLAIGSLAAVVLMVGCHCAAGRRGLKRLQEESAEADAAMTRHDGMVRNLVRAGMSRDRHQRLRASRFRLWTLLKRLESMLLVEMQPAASSVAPIEPKTAPALETQANECQNESESVRASFLSRTRCSFGPYELKSNREFREKVSDIVKQWWAGTGVSRKTPSRLPTNFAQLWKFLSDIDQENAGHYPAHVVVPELRSFVARFLDDVRLTAGRSVVHDHLDELRDGVFKWFESVVKTDVSLYCSAAITPLHVNERRQSSPVVYFTDNGGLVQMDRIEASARETRTIYGTFRTLRNPLLSLTTHLALMYQEFIVKFECVEDTARAPEPDDGTDDPDQDAEKSGNLAFMELSDE